MVNNIVSETFKRCRQFISDIFGHSEDSEYTKYLNKRLDVWESDVRASFNIGPYAIEHISLENEEHPSSFEDLTADRIRKEWQYDAHSAMGCALKIDIFVLAKALGHANPPKIKIPA